MIHAQPAACMVHMLTLKSFADVIILFSWFTQTNILATNIIMVCCKGVQGKNIWVTISNTIFRLWPTRLKMIKYICSCVLIRKVFQWMNLASALATATVTQGTGYDFTLDVPKPHHLPSTSIWKFSGPSSLILHSVLLTSPQLWFSLW